ncbi:MAG: hypothetical protein BroJett038_24370 [Chloroflexota bacterium]|nr:MAG: hypothetical protein BroJett038_24370 [Chloroflexota bacterium]
MNVCFVDKRQGHDMPVRVVFGTYREGGTPCIQLLTREDGELCEPWLTATVNLPEHAGMLGEGEVWIRDYSENEGVARLLLENGILAGGPVRTATAGHALVHAYRLSDEALQLVSEAKARMANRRPAALPDEAALAMEFCRILGETLNAEQIAEVVRRNAEEVDSNVCHSHDFCDANVVMHAAFGSFGVDPMASGENDEGMSDEVIALWNAAWDMAKFAEFSARHVAPKKAMAKPS